MTADHGDTRAMPDYRSVPGNLGVQILHRLEGDRAHFLTVTWWESRQAIAAFAGQHIEIAQYYPEDRPEPVEAFGVTLSSCILMRDEVS